MDGVIYRGSQLIPGADDFIARLKKGNHGYLFLTNNSKKTPLDLRRKLLAMGIDVPIDRFYTSAMATALFLKRQHPGGSAFVVGDSGLTSALYDVGYSITSSKPDYVVFGETNAYGFDLVTKAIRLIIGGAKFIATNPDVVGPTEEGISPACGALTAPIERATGVAPYIVGKPNPLMMRIAIDLLEDHSENAVMVGDRMDTDIVAGLEAGMTTCLVLTGVSSRDTLRQFAYAPDHILESVADIVPDRL